MLKKILMIATGGTIASSEGENGLTPALTGEALTTNVPGIQSICNLTVLQLMNIDSTNIRPKHWLMIRDAIVLHYDSYDGFVILHGTDTMAYTAAALSYLIQNSAKPIVLTGSQKPMISPYTDAKINIYQSILYVSDDKSYNVSIVFNGKAIAGTRARKQRTRNFNGFESMNFPTLALIHDDNIIRHTIPDIPASSEFRTYQSLNDKVFVIKLIPMMTADIFHLIKDHYDAIVLEAFGIGGIPEHDDSFERAIFEWVDSGKMLAITTQVPEEGCDLSVYQVGKKYSTHSGILKTGTMTTEALVAKLMWVLGQTNDREEINRLFYKPINFDQ